MYRYSLGVFLGLFRRALSADGPTAGGGGDVTARIAALGDKLLELALGFVSRALFNGDRLTFAMHLAHHLLPQGTVRAEEWAFLLGMWYPVSLSLCSCRPAV
jgi:hypothetical protein